MNDGSIKMSMDHEAFGMIDGSDGWSSRKDRPVEEYWILDR